MLCRQPVRSAVETSPAPCVSALRRGRSERRRDSYIHEAAQSHAWARPGRPAAKLWFMEPPVFEAMQ